MRVDGISSLSHPPDLPTAQYSDLKEGTKKDKMRSLAFIIVYVALHALASPAVPLHERQAGGGCKKVYFIFARGSTEPGTMGTTVGPAFTSALKTKFGANEVSSEGVSYPADIAGAFSGGTNPSGSPGATKMTSMAKAVLQRCPNARIVLSGYSQGAEQVHGALFAKNLGEDGARITAAVTFGDPLKNYQQFGPGTWGSLPPERTLVFCNQGDGVCGGAFSISAAHLSYTSNGDIAKGVAFVAKQIEALGPGPLKAAPPPPGANTGAIPAKGAGGAAAPKGSGGAAPKGSGGAAPKGSGGAGASKGVPKGGSSGPPPAASPPAASPPEVPEVSEPAPERKN